MSLLEQLRESDLALKSKLVSKDLMKTKNGRLSKTPAKRSREVDNNVELELELEKVRAERDMLQKEVAKLTQMNSMLNQRLKAYEPSAEDAGQLAEKTRVALYQKIVKAMSVWKPSCGKNGARFTVYAACSPAVLAALVGDTLYAAAVKGSKATKASININLNSEALVRSVFGGLPEGKVRYCWLGLKLGGTSGLKLKLDKATNELHVSGVYGKFFGSEC